MYVSCMKTRTYFHTPSRSSTLVKHLLNGSLVPIYSVFQQSVTGENCQCYTANWGIFCTKSLNCLWNLAVNQEHLEYFNNPYTFRLNKLLFKENILNLIENKMKN